MATEKAISETPKSARIGPFRYQIDFDAEACYDYSYLGVCLYRSKRIKLDPRQSDTELPQTLLHELLHALGGAFEITDWERHTTDVNGAVVDKIDLMASALLRFMMDNPEIIKWLQAQK